MKKSSKERGNVKHIPMRTCIGSGEKHAKRDMIRLVRTAEGNIVVDPTGKRPGSRGAYLSKSYAAATMAVRQKKLEAEFEQAVSEEDKQSILEYFKQFEGVHSTL
jgi:hypothetical protein